MCPRPVKNPDQDQQTRDRIIDLAYSAFAKNGYSKTSLQSIANELGITRPALYYHFASKEDLFIEVYDSVESGTMTDPSAVIGADDEATFKRELEIYFRGIASGLRGDDERLRFVAASESVSTELPALRQRVAENNVKMLGNLEQIVRRGIELGAIDEATDPKAMAAYLSVIVFGVGDVMLRHGVVDLDSLWGIVTKSLYA
ncbi:MAG: TetR/AcrR family transcriptional regulator [Eggerthellales bacterium]|nr:TetR/AcrR family transcriptional regulator [Eggerthellales bacterium]